MARPPHRLLSVLAALVLGQLGQACALPAVDGDSEDSRSVEGKADLADQAALAAELAPAYRLTLRSHLVTRDTNDGSLTTLESRVEGFVIAASADGALALEFQPCSVDLPEVSGRKPKLRSRDLVASLHRSRTLATLAEDASGVVSLHTESSALVLGASLAAPELDPLPTDEDDASMLDQDQDGKPGVTVEVSGFAVYLAARARFWMSGSENPDTGVFSGQAELGIDVEIFDDNIPFYDAREKAAEAAAHTEVTVSEESFELTPLDAVPTSCAAL